MRWKWHCQSFIHFFLIEWLEQIYNSSIELDCEHRRAVIFREHFEVPIEKSLFHVGGVNTLKRKKLDSRLCNASLEFMNKAVSSVLIGKWDQCY